MSALLKIHRGKCSQNPNFGDYITAKMMSIDMDLLTPELG